LRGFNFREKLEEKNKRSRKCFEFLNKWCKTKKSGGAKCKKHRHISKRIKIPGGAPAPPQYYIAPPLLNVMYVNPSLFRGLLSFAFVTHKSFKFFR
jgi:hypothetical protein